VPEARTRALIDALPARPQVLRFDAAGHDDIGAFPQYADTLSAFMR
jgi:hypothetical protein